MKARKNSNLITTFKTNLQEIAKKLHTNWRFKPLLKTLSKTGAHYDITGFSSKKIEIKKCPKLKNLEQIEKLQVCLNKL
jgi:hypothetical protein